MKILIWNFLCYFLLAVQCFPQVTNTNDIVVISTTALPNETTTEQHEDDVPTLPKIYEMRIDTNVSNRFAKTQVTSKVKNLDNKSREATFSVIIPDQAFISGFTMEIGGKSYEAYVQEKEKAKNTYQQAVASGQSAAHVAVNARDSNRFTVSVNVAPKSKAVFYLRYEELLKRQSDKYEIVINIHPSQPVNHLNVEVHINESRPLKFVRANPLRTGNEIPKMDEKLNPEADIQKDERSAVVKFNPNKKKQKQYAEHLGTKQKNGLAGQFVVEYDVERDPQGGEILVNEGYFVHFFAPQELQAIPKQVVFVLDTSGSMSGIRIQQLKEAMHKILSELKHEDLFSILEFGSYVKVWNIENVAVQYQTGRDYWDPVIENVTNQSIPAPYQANEENIKNAGKVVDKLNALGGTDINSALQTSIKLVENHLQKDDKHQPIIVFLTDGEASVGETNNDRIIRTITELNSKATPIFSLSFGDGADRYFLQQISLKNFGFARHIYEAADASLQLEEFYKEISSPLLSNVTFKYVSNVSEVTKTVFPFLFNGSELVVAGLIDDLLIERQDPGLDRGFGIVNGWSINGPVKLIPKVEKSVNSIERLWAYLTLKQILQEREAADDKTDLTAEALKIALKYSFVSDVSSLVVVKPNETEKAVDTEDASNSRYPYYSSAMPLSYPVLGSASPHGNLQGFSSPHIALGNFGPPAPISADPYFLPPRESLQSVPKIQTTIRYTSTTIQPVIEVSSDEKKEDIEFSLLKAKLPWLTSILNSNGTINISSGIYSLGLNKTLTESPECPKSPLDAPGSLGSADSFSQPEDLDSSILEENPEEVTQQFEEELTTVYITESNVEDFNLTLLTNNLPWLTSVLYENGTIQISSGTYLLGLNETINDVHECSPSPSKETSGHCVLINNCPEVFPQIKDLQTYEKYFCNLKGYAGICCPITKEVRR